MAAKQVWTDSELRNRAYDIAQGYSLPLSLIKRIENAMIVMRAESEAAPGVPAIPAIPAEVADTIRRSLVSSESINDTLGWMKRVDAAQNWLQHAAPQVAPGEDI